MSTTIRKTSASKSKRSVPRRIVLSNPIALTEDEADGLISEKRLKTEKPIPLSKVLKRYGYEKLER